MPILRLEKQELLEITRMFLGQHHFNDLLLQLREVLHRLQLADGVALVLFTSDREQVTFHGLDHALQPVTYRDDRLLATGPVSRFLHSPLAQCWSVDDLYARYPQISSLALYPPFNHYCLMPLYAAGQLLGGCELLRSDSQPFSDADLVQLQTLMELVALATEQITLAETAA